jgi:hypothetical protein
MILLHGRKSRLRKNVYLVYFSCMPYFHWSITISKQEELGKLGLSLVLAFKIYFRILITNSGTQLNSPK